MHHVMLDVYIDCDWHMRIERIDIMNRGSSHIESLESLWKKTHCWNIEKRRSTPTWLSYIPFHLAFFRCQGFILLGIQKAREKRQIPTNPPPIYLYIYILKNCISHLRRFVISRRRTSTRYSTRFLEKVHSRGWSIWCSRSNFYPARARVKDFFFFYVSMGN